MGDRVLTPARSPRALAPDVGDPVLRDFAELVLGAGYDSPPVNRARQVRRLVRAPAVSSAGASQLGTLTELLAIGRSVPRAEAERALAPLPVEGLVDAGLLELDAGAVSSPYRAVTYEGLLLLGDDLLQPGADVVAAVYQPSFLVARLTPRTPRRSMLDLGSGAGIQALLAARHCEQVVAVDINARALSLATINARLNGIENVQWREGSWFTPAAGERFELIVCNPPYVISPDAELTYRDSGMAPGALVAQLCREAPEHLEEDGLAIVLCMWPHADEDDWDAVPREWAAQTGCDSIVVCLDTSDPLEQAVRWNSPPSRYLGPEAYFDTVERWHRFYEENAIGAVSFGAVVLRRQAAGHPWSLVTRTSQMPGPRAARQLERVIAGNDLLRGDGDLLARRYSVPDGLSLSQRYQRRDSRWVGRPPTAGVSDELGAGAAVDPDSLDVLFRCTGTATIAELMADAHHPEAVRASVRELLRHGLLEVH